MFHHTINNVDQSPNDVNHCLLLVSAFLLFSNILVTHDWVPGDTTFIIGNMVQGKHIKGIVQSPLTVTVSDLLVLFNRANIHWGNTILSNLSADEYRVISPIRNFPLIVIECYSNRLSGTLVFSIYVDINFREIFWTGAIVMSSISSVSNLRIGGLASGIDTDSIVKNLMKVKRMPVDKLKQEKQILNWQQEDYRDINSTLRGFRDKLFAMKLQSTYLMNSATSSNETAVSASANSNAKRGIYSVTVSQLANGVAKGSQETLLEESNADGTTKTLAGQFSGLPKSISFTLEGTNGYENFTFDTSTATIYSVASEINAANLGISANYDATLNRFFLNTTTTGSDAKIKVIDDESYFPPDSINFLRLNLEVGTEYNGQDAIYNFGDMTGLTSATNSPTVNGITFNLKQEGATSTISITSNTDAVFNNIKDFVTAYNDILAKINDKLSETRYRDYPPLTDEQRDAMSEKDIEKWEKFARSGLMKNDPLLNGPLEKMRTNLYSSVSGLTGYKNLAEIGITSGSYMEKGKLYLDETKLKKALQNDPEEVMNLFSKVSDNQNEKGIAVRLYDNVNNAMTLLAEKAGNSSSYGLVDSSIIGKSLASIDKNIKTWDDRLKDIEDRYWRQFSAMEEAISRMNSQSAWLSQQLGTSSN